MKRLKQNTDWLKMLYKHSYNIPIDKYFRRFLLIVSGVLMLYGVGQAQSSITYNELRKNFSSPDYSRWGEVPLWWWEADSLSKERITWELEKLADKGVKAVCPIQRSPARTYPESFSEEWWDLIDYAHKEAKRLGMELWIYDQVGYGQYGWLEKAAAQVENTETSRIEFLTDQADSNETVSLNIPDGRVLDARAYPVVKDTARDKNSFDLSGQVENNLLTWSPRKGSWKIAVSVAVPYKSFYLNEKSTDVFIDLLYERIEDMAGEEAMGKSLAGIFQDEHPPTPRNIYSEELAQTFETMFGYPIARAIPALHFDVGEKTPKYRIDFFDAYLSVLQKTYWKKIYDWTASRDVLTSHDNWGRNNIYRQSEGYIDYFRTQRWFSAPGLDDYNNVPLEYRNYYDTKIASSIARLYNRPRVWAEAFHSSGWGRTTNQTLSWLSTLYAFGANLYDEHGLYYALNASTWEHAAPDPHFRQPYWRYYQQISDWVARTSYLMSQGSSVADVAVHYPVVSLLAEIERSDIDYNRYMELSRIIYNEGMDNDIIDDQSILEGTIENGRLKVGKNEYRALVFGPERTMRLPVLKKARKLAEQGGTVLFYGELPTGSVENGRKDEEITAILNEIFHTNSLETGNQNGVIEHRFDSGGYAASRRDMPKLLASILSSHIDRDFIPQDHEIYVSHRKIGKLDAYLVQNTEDKAIELDAHFRSRGVPELWDPFTGKVNDVKWYRRNGKYTRTKLRIDGQVAKLLVFKPGSPTNKTEENPFIDWTSRTLSENWEFAVIPTRDNQWGDFRWPPEEEKIGPEIRRFKYKEETDSSGIKLGWTRPGYNDSNWQKTLYSKGPHWVALQSVPSNAKLVKKVLDNQKNIVEGQKIEVNGKEYDWQAISFSQKIGLGKPAPWGGHSGYPDGHFDKNFVQLGEGRKILFSRIYSPRKQQAGLNVQLRNTETVLYVNGEKQPCRGAVCNLPLNKGYNNVLLDIPNGTGGKLYVQEKPPVITENEEDIYPNLKDASWIWFGNTDGTYLRKNVNLKELPKSAHIVVTGVTGFKLFINGKKVREEIGPWANWDYPENIDISSYLKEGENTIGIWGQFYQAQHFFADLTDQFKGVAAAVKVVYDDGNTLEIQTNNTWKGHTEELDQWTSSSLDVTGWSNAKVKGKVGNKPWGKEFLKNIGSSTTPYRPLSVNLSSPNIQVFNQKPNIIYDVKPKSANRIGWYRFEAPPGLHKLTFHTEAQADVWVNGRKIPIDNKTAIIERPPVNVSTVSVRLDMLPGEYAGAAFDLPIEIGLKGGEIQTGPWKHFALPTYSGIGVYKQNISLSDEEAEKEVQLDLGEVRVAAEVLVNDKSAGVRVAHPFKFNLTDYIKSGENEIEVRVANTLAPHFSDPDRTMHPGPSTSGLIGPVSLNISAE